MNGRWQFSIRYLLLETFWVAVACGLVRVLVVFWDASTSDPSVVIAIMGSFCGLTIVIPIAIGGLVGRMKIGAIVGCVLFCLLCVLPMVLARIFPPGGIGAAG